MSTSHSPTPKPHISPLNFTNLSNVSPMSPSRTKSPSSGFMPRPKSPSSTFKSSPSSKSRPKTRAQLFRNLSRQLTMDRTMNDILGFYDENDGTVSAGESEVLEVGQEGDSGNDHAPLGSPTALSTPGMLDSPSRNGSMAEDDSEWMKGSPKESDSLNNQKEDIIADRNALNELNRMMMEDTKDGFATAIGPFESQEEVEEYITSPPFEQETDSTADGSKRRYPPISSPTYSRKKRPSSAQPSPKQLRKEAQRKQRLEYSTSLAQLLNYLDACHKQFDPNEVTRLREKQINQMKEMMQLERERRSLRDICEYSLPEAIEEKGFPNGRLPLDAYAGTGPDDGLSRGDKTQESLELSDPLLHSPSLHRLSHSQHEQMRELLNMKFGALQVQIIDDFAGERFVARGRGGLKRRLSLAGRSLER